jgi:MHS family proline/betaine transporter-like MFS transporter
MAASAAAETSPEDKKRLKKVVGAGMIGNALEWYDFALYGHFAAILSQLYFHSDNPMTSLLATYGAFAAGFAMRPIGAVMFGWIGDRYGRKISLAIAILLMAIPTACIGLLPTYAQIGILAPILLTLIRLLQGLSLGGEFSGSITFMVEHAGPKHRGLVGSASMASLVIGMLAGSLVATAITAALSEEDLLSWGWRIPFIFGIVIGVVGFYIRHHTEESPSYVEAKENNQLSDAPLKEAWKLQKKELFQGVGLYLTVTVPFYTFSVFMITYLTKMEGHALSFALLLNSVGMTVTLATLVIGAWLSDKYGRNTVLGGGALAFLLLIYPLFLAITSGNIALLWLGILGFGAILGIYIGPMPAVLVELFPARVRFTGMAVSYNVAAALFGGTAPMVCTWLIDRTGNHSVIAFYVMLCAIISLITLRWVRDRYAEDID